MSWEQLQQIGREAAEHARDEKTRPPVACPNDGQPLQAGRRGGEVHCPWGDYQWPRDGHQ